MYDEEAALRGIIAFAEGRNDISYVIQNGSRVNPNVVSDAYADFDIVMGCADPSPYLRDRGWMAEFGKLLILQQNEVAEPGLVWPIFLMQFRDGLRIDLQFYPGDADSIYHADTLSRILLDKGTSFTGIFEPSELGYVTGRPDAREYVNEVNEFWWCAVNVAKGIARRELTYARYMYESVVRGSFLKIVSWYVSARKGWSVNTGKYGKFLEKRADADVWERIAATYRTDDDEAFWKSLAAACGLVRAMDGELRRELRVADEAEDAEGIMRFIEAIRAGTP